MKLKTLAAAMTLSASLFTVATSASAASLPSYEKVSGISGNLSSVGSDTLANMMTFWAEEFKTIQISIFKFKLLVLQLLHLL